VTPYEVRYEVPQPCCGHATFSARARVTESGPGLRTCDFPLWHLEEGLTEPMRVGRRHGQFHVPLGLLLEYGAVPRKSVPRVFRCASILALWRSDDVAPVDCTTR
jgi:hypothetical protein